MGAEQSSEPGKPRTIETANFEFRYEPVTRERGVEVSRSTNNSMKRETETSKGRGWLDEQSSSDRFSGWKNDKSSNIYSRQDKNSCYWLEEGMDAVKNIEKEGVINFYAQS